MGKKFISIISFFAVLVVFGGLSPKLKAQEEGVFNTSGLPIPRFVSLRSDKVFVRTGPALRYPIKWVFQRENLPVEVIQEFDTWRKIKDHEGQEGWIHQSLTHGKRYGLVMDDKNDAIIYRKADETSKPVAIMEPMVVVRLEECLEEYCRITKSGYKGWMKRNFLYGIYGHEKFD